MHPSCGFLESLYCGCDFDAVVTKCLQKTTGNIILIDEILVALSLMSRTGKNVYYSASIQHCTGHSTQINRSRKRYKKFGDHKIRNKVMFDATIIKMDNGRKPSVRMNH